MRIIINGRIRGGIKLPWINKNKCTGCGICVEECLVNAITIKENKAEINMNECIRCGKCHDICPQEAVRHDSEKIPVEVEQNLNKTKQLIKNFKTKEEQEAFLGRMIKYYNKERTVAERTIMKIKEMM